MLGGWGQHLRQTLAVRLFFLSLCPIKLHRWDLFNRLSRFNQLPSARIIHLNYFQLRANWDVIYDILDSSPLTVFPLHPLSPLPSLSLPLCLSPSFPLSVQMWMSVRGTLVEGRAVVWTPLAPTLATATAATARSSPRTGSSAMVRGVGKACWVL